MYCNHNASTFKDTSRDPELFGIENAALRTDFDLMPLIDGLDPGEEGAQSQEDTLDLATAPPIGAPYGPPQQKRHIGAVYRSGFLPTYRSLRSISGSLGGGGGGGGGGHFSRSGRARQFVWVNGGEFVCYLLMNLHAYLLYLLLHIHLYIYTDFIVTRNSKKIVLNCVLV